MNSTSAPPGRIHLYEVVNYGRRETLIALTPDAPADFLWRLASPRPQPIAHWGADETFELEQLAEAVPAGDADEFLKLYLENTRNADWKTVVWRP